jgi:hypothetical protein
VRLHGGRRRRHAAEPPRHAQRAEQKAKPRCECNGTPLERRSRRGDEASRKQRVKPNTDGVLLNNDLSHPEWVGDEGERIPAATR